MENDSGWKAAAIGACHHKECKTLSNSIVLHVSLLHIHWNKDPMLPLVINLNSSLNSPIDVFWLDFVLVQHQFDCLKPMLNCSRVESLSMDAVKTGGGLIFDEW